VWAVAVLEDVATPQARKLLETLMRSAKLSRKGDVRSGKSPRKAVAKVEQAVKKCASEVVRVCELAWFRAEAGLVFAQGEGKIMGTLELILLVVVLLFLLGGGG
jgi:hypothetical protein